MTRHAPRLTAEAPWAGPAAYSEDDADFFKGRTAEAAEVHRLIQSEPASLLYGVSGVGKTSLLQAGVFPHLRTGGWLPLLIRLDHRDKDDDGRLLPSLTAQILTKVTEAAQACGLALPEWDTGKDTLATAFGERGARLRGGTLVLVFDQFEECWTLTRDRPEARDRVSAMLHQIEALAGKPKGAETARSGRPGAKEPLPAALHVVFAMRENASADLQILQNRIPVLSQAQFHLLPFATAQVREAAVMPGQHLFDDGVADAILDTFAARDAGRAAVDPAHVSIFCWLLNERRRKSGGAAITLADADSLIGGMSAGFVRQFYECAFAALPEDLAAGTRLFVEDHLVDAGGYRSSAAIRLIEEKHGVTAATLDQLLGARLIHHVERHGGHCHVELVHDRIAAEAVSHRTRRNFHMAKQQERAAELHDIVAAHALREKAEASEREIESLRQEIERLRGKTTGTAETCEASEVKTDISSPRRQSNRLIAPALVAAGVLMLILFITTKRVTPTQSEVEAANKAAKAALAEASLQKSEADKYRAAAEKESKALDLARNNSENHDVFMMDLMASILSKIAEGIQTQQDKDALKPVLEDVSNGLEHVSQSGSLQIKQSQARVLKVIQRINATLPAPPNPVPPSLTPPVMLPRPTQPALQKVSQLLNEARKEVETGNYDSGLEKCKAAIAQLDASRKEDQGDWALANTLYASALVGTARRELDLEQYDSCITKCKDAIARLADPSSKDYWVFWTSAHAIHAEALLERGVNEKPVIAQETYLEALRIVEQGLAGKAPARQISGKSPLIKNGPDEPLYKRESQAGQIKAAFPDRYARLLELKGAAFAGLSILVRSTDESASAERWRQAIQAWDEALSATRMPLFEASIHRAKARGFLERAQMPVERAENLKDGLLHAEEAVKLATEAKDKPGGRLIRAKALYTLCVALEMKYANAGTVGTPDVDEARLTGLTKEVAEEFHALIPGTARDREMQNAAAVTRHERLRERQNSEQNPPGPEMPGQSPFKLRHHTPDQPLDKRDPASPSGPLQGKKESQTPPPAPR